MSFVLFSVTNAHGCSAYVKRLGGIGYDFQPKQKH